MTVPKSFRFCTMNNSKQFSYSWEGAQEWCLDDDFCIAAEKFVAEYAPFRVSYTLTRENYFRNGGNIRRWLQQKAKVGGITSMKVGTVRLIPTLLFLIWPIRAIC